MIKQGQIDQINAKFQEAETAYYDRGKFNEALDIYMDILSGLLNSRESPENTRQWIPSILVVIERLVDLSVLFDKFSAADPLLEGMVKLYEEDGDRYGVDYTLVKRIHINLMFGHLREAYTILETMSTIIEDIHAIEFSSKGLQMWETSLKWPGKTKEDHMALLVRLYLAMGMILACLGQYSDSIAACEQGIFHCDKHHSELIQEVSLPLHLMLAEANLEKGELTLAANQLEKLHKTFDPIIKQTQPGHYVHLLELSGKLSLLRGEFGNGLTCFKDIVSFCQEQGFPHAAIQNALNLAQVMILLNQVGEAKKILIKIKINAKKTGDQTTRRRAIFLIRLAYKRSHSLIDGPFLSPTVMEMQKGKKTHSSGKYVKDIDPFELPQSSNYLAFFEERALGFYWRLARDIAETENYLAGLIETFKDTDSQLILVRLKLMCGLLAYYKNIQNPQEAENILDETRPILEKKGLKHDLWQTLRFKRWCAARLNRSEKMQNELIMQTDALLTEMADSLEGADRAIFLLNKWTVEEEMLKVKIERLQYLEDKCMAAAWIKRPFLKWRLFKQLNALVISIDAKKDLEAKRLLKEEKIAQQEKANRSFLWDMIKPSFKKITLSFLVLPDRVLVTFRKWLSFGFRVIPITRIEIREKVKQWHELIVHLKKVRDLFYNNSGDGIEITDINELEGKAKEIAAKITQQLQIPEILKKLPDGSSLKIFPDDVLYGFPFAAIFYDGKYLVERFALSIDFEHHLPPNKPRTAKVGKALLVGVSVPVMNNPPLPGVPQEIERIKNWYQSCKVEPLHLFDQYADKKTVLNHLPQCKYFHIACHGTFKPDKPGESGLLLSPAPGEIEMLSIRELSKLNLAGLEHATLSSCWSADNFITPGRIIISLPETLRRAGAGSILGSLWPLHDSFATAFMERFYKYLETYPRDIALQKTQLDCINKKLTAEKEINTGNPSHWAAFTLYGTSKRLPTGVLGR